MTLPARPSPSPFTNLLVWKLWRLRRILNLELFYMSNGVDVPEAGVELLLELMQAPEGLTQRQLGDRLRLRGSTISVAIKSLAAQGLVRKDPKVGDGRAWRVTLTKEAPTGDLARWLESIESPLTKTFSKEELRLVGRVLDEWVEAFKAGGGFAGL